MTKSNRRVSKLTFPLYSHPAWSFLALFIIVIFVFATQYLQNELYNGFTFSVGILSILSLLTPLFTYYLYRTFLSLQDIASTLTETNQQEWFLQQKQFIFGVNHWSIIVVVLLAIGGEITNYYLVWGIWTGIAKFFYFLHAGILFSILGMLVWTYFGILLFTYRLSNLHIDPEPFETKRDEFDKLNASLLGMFFAGVIMYLGAIISGWLSPFSSYMLQQFILQYWVFPLAVVVLGFFVLIQYFLHTMMKKAKRIRLNKILLLIRKHYSEWEKSQSANHSAAINDLLSWKEKIEKETDFPFDFFTIASVLVTVLLPTIKTIIELL
jgi:hypothetical protein